MTLVVAFPHGKKDRSALHLAAVLARSGGRSLRIVSVVPAPGPNLIPRGNDLQFAAWSRERGERAVAEARRAAAEICPDVPSEALYITGQSTARALVAHAVAVDAAMIVMGSGTDGAWGKVVLSSTSDRLLHSSPVPVALAPRGYRAEPRTRVVRVTCAFRGDAGSREVLERTLELARAVGARSRIATFGVGGRTMVPAQVGEEPGEAAYVEQVSAAQEAAVRGVDDSYGELVEEVVGTGRSWRAALSSLDWDPAEVLVVGSSSEGGRSRLFLGSNATKIIRHTPVPVVLVP